MPSQRRPLLRGDSAVALGLALATLAVYWPLPDTQFTNHDDPFYVTGNGHVTGGLTSANAWWALTSFERSNWHPLTWLSLQLDAQLFSAKAFWFAVTNLLLHIANVLVLFVVWRQLTGEIGPSALVAALFALHPLHVESVAWVSERKDVLSTLFWMLTLWAYIGYTRKPGVLRYAATALAFVLGLTAKPMLVTLPFVLLLLDYWPLRRFGTADAPRLRALVIEKVPLFILSAATCVVTVVAQGSGTAIGSLAQFTLSDRLTNALVSYAIYLVQTIWPFNLAVHYPYEHLAWTDGRVLGACLLLGAITALSVWQAGKRPFLLVGWFWYLGTLVPVIGLVQVGSQAHADRYTYIPLIGIFVMVAWSLAELARRNEGTHRLVRAVSVALLICCAALTWLQVTHWHDSFALWGHALTATGPNAEAHNGLAAAFRDARDLGRAVEHYDRAVEISPGDTHARWNLGMCLLFLGRLDDASAQFSEILRIEPNNANTHFQLGVIAGLEGRTGEAVACYEEVLRLRPEDASAHVNLAGELVKQGQCEEALRHLVEAERYRPEVRAMPAYQAALRAAKEKQASR
jgi:cytochrome c-type biogenesis protein CcmH/NrfG